MAFKSVEQYNEDRYRNLFRITDDGMSADVVFLYRSKAEMLVADVHYIKSVEYSGYVHCIGTSTGTGCPACKAGIKRVSNKLFIPIYNFEKDAIEFWDKNMSTKFLAQLDRDVFNRFANPSEYVFRITRHGAYHDIDTYYDIVPVGKNSRMPYDQILAKFNAVMPDYYENIVKTVSASDLSNMLQRQSSNNAVEQEYIPIPRAGYQSSIPNTYVNAAEAVAAPVVSPTVSAPIAETPVDEDAPFDTDDDDGDYPEPQF